MFRIESALSVAIRYRESPGHQKPCALRAVMISAALAQSSCPWGGVIHSNNTRAMMCCGKLGAYVVVENQTQCIETSAKAKERVFDVVQITGICQLMSTSFMIKIIAWEKVGITNAHAHRLTQYPGWKIAVVVKTFS